MRDLSGSKFGRLTVLGFKERVSKSRYMWSCRCDCGAEKAVDGWKLRSGETQSCGCLLAERRIESHTTHGLHGTPEYAVWHSMTARCHNPKNKSFHRYGGRGIEVCERWRRSFSNFIADMGRRPAGGTLDRINNDGNYEPGNCRWATMKVQQRNRGDNLRVLSGGRLLLLKEACEQRGLSYNTIWQRINTLGWSVEKSLSAAVR